MSKPALATILALVAAFAAFQVALNYALRQVNDDVTSACLKPVSVPPMRSVLLIDTSKPMSRGVMR